MNTLNQTRYPQQLGIIVALMLICACSSQTEISAKLNANDSAGDALQRADEEVTLTSTAIEHEVIDTMVFEAAASPNLYIADAKAKRSHFVPVIGIPSEPIPTAENRETYADGQVTPIKSVAIEPVSTFSVDVDTASYINVRRMLEQGSMPPNGAVRVEEFINYFSYALPAADSAERPLSIDTGVMTTPWNQNTQLLRVSLQSHQSEFRELPPVNLVFLLDVSGSMSSPNKLPMMQNTFDVLVNQLRPQDRVAIVVYAGASGVVLEPTSGDEKQTIKDAIHALQAGGSTHGSAGIHLAYATAEKHFVEGGINRVILGTDGDFNVGTTGIEIGRAHV